MLSAFEQSVSGLFATLLNAAGVQVAYRRGDQVTNLVAVPAMSQFRLDDDAGSGITVNLKVQDYLVHPDDLQFNGQRSEPQPGDQIEVQRADGLHVFRVAGPGGGEPDWRWSDTGRTRLRIHTKFVEIIK